MKLHTGIKYVFMIFNHDETYAKPEYNPNTPKNIWTDSLDFVGERSISKTVIEFLKVIIFLWVYIVFKC